MKRSNNTCSCIVVHCRDNTSRAVHVLVYSCTAAGAATRGKNPAAASVQSVHTESRSRFYNSYIINYCAIIIQHSTVHGCTTLGPQMISLFIWRIIARSRSGLHTHACTHKGLRVLLRAAVHGEIRYCARGQPREDHRASHQRAGMIVSSRQQPERNQLNDWPVLGTTARTPYIIRQYQFI